MSGIDHLPAGWYRAAGPDLGPGAVRPVRGLGVDLVAWATPDGEAHAADAHCPHLGAHLGYGSCVTDVGDLRCGFHGWRYGPDGSNTASSGDGPAVPAARLRTHPTVRLDGAVYTFLDGGTGVAPWAPADWEPAGEGPPVLVRHGAEDLTAHQQVVLEGDFDETHFGPVHGQGFAQVEPTFDGPRAGVRYTTGGRRPQTIEIRLDGLSRMWQRVTVGSVVVGYRADYLSTGPTSCRAETTVAVWAPSEAAAERTLRRMGRVLEKDIANDARIWEHRRYDRGDRLGAADRGVVRFRRWAAQFYPDSTAAARSSASATKASRAAVPSGPERSA